MKLVTYLLEDLPTEDVLRLTSYIQEVHLKPNEVFISKGEISTKVRYIKEGLVRAYTYDDEGREITFIFRWENQFFRPYESLLRQPSKYYFQALEATSLLELDFQIIQDYVAEHTEYAYKLNELLKNTLFEALEHLESFVLLSPEKRYLKIINEKPDIIHRVQDKYIASFLGITPVSLSRIKKRIATRRH